MSTSSSTSGTRTIHLVLAWAFVGIPLLWGVLQTLRNAMKLFH
ncbi:MAG TPA: hypothetical protein VHV80_11010 [Steroidobacteraceae bacterium]|jgi:hypothetical protein|nr:hypothetical protein [Steroidobacteraceae bacterium]